MIVALSSRSSQDIGDYAQPRESIASGLGCGLDFGLGGAFRDMYCWLLLGLRLGLASRFLGDELLLDFVWMQQSRFLTVGFVYFVLICIRFDSKEIVECDIGPFCGSDFISQTEDFLICDLLLML